MLHLDSDEQVVKWSYEKLIIEYVSNKSSGRIRKYYPDFFVEYKDGTKRVIEIKQKRKLDTVAVKKKSKAAEQWCEMHGATFLVLTEIELKELKII